MMLRVVPWLLAAAPLAAQEEGLLREYLKRLDKLRESDAEGHHRLGQWCRDRGLFDLAEQRFEKVLALQPEHKEAREALGYLRKGDRWVESPARLLRQRAVRAVRDGLQLPAAEVREAWKKKSAMHKKGIEILCYPEVWVQGLMAIHEQTGLFDGEIRIQVSFTEQGGVGEGAIGRGIGQNGNGSIAIDMDKVAGYLQKVARYEKDRKRGRVTVFVPPVRLEVIVWHELTHVFQDLHFEPWFSEGMACYATRSPYYYHVFNRVDGRVTPIDECPTAKGQNYGRGCAFFAWIEATAGKEKVREFCRLTIRERKPIAEAVETVTGIPWADAVKRERAWSEKFLAGQKPE